MPHLEHAGTCIRVHAFPKGQAAHGRPCCKVEIHPERGAAATISLPPEKMREVIEMMIEQLWEAEQ